MAHVTPEPAGAPAAAGAEVTETLLTWNGTMGNTNAGTFIHVAALNPQQDRAMLCVGAMVSFIPGKGTKPGQIVAENGSLVVVGPPETLTPQSPTRVSDATKQILSDQGYETLEDVLATKRTRQDWISFAERVGIPDAEIVELAPRFGPDFTFLRAQLHLDRPERLALELRSWFGADFDKALKNSVQGDFVKIAYVIHDTSVNNLRQMNKDGVMRPNAADDQWYDGMLTRAEAPKVVFFQASKAGTDKSIYPRCVPDPSQKGRVLLPPAYIGLHTDAFRMYLVRISEPREGKGILQMHLLFISPTHSAIEFCDANFLLINKKMFQPFRYDSTAGVWIGSNHQTGGSTFQGRGVKINVCVAQHVALFGLQEFGPLSQVPSGTPQAGWSTPLW